MTKLCNICLILVIIGALNWGLVGLLDMNLVDMVLGEMLAKIVYILVGAAGVMMAAKVKDYIK